MKFTLPISRMTILLAATLLVPCSARADELTATQKAWLAKGSRHAKAGWIYLHIEGSPEERGFQHGYLLAPEIGACLAAYRAIWVHESSMSWAWLVANTRGFLDPGIDPEDRAELNGIVEGMRAHGVGATFDDLVTSNAWLELSWYWWPQAEKKLTDGFSQVSPPKIGCSSFIATGRMTKDGGIVLGHNTMDEYFEAFANVIEDVVPAKGHRILMQTEPGWIDSGTDFFITDAGLVGSETTIDGFQDYEDKGIPEFIRMRRATQDANSIDEWCAIMKAGNNGGYANAWLIGDVRSGEIARLELGLKYVGFERTKDGYFIGSNIAENLHILRLETNYTIHTEADIRLSSVARRVRWKQLMKANAGKIDLALAEQMEADCADACVPGQTAKGRGLAGHDELDSQPAWAGDAPYEPDGSFDAKVVDSRMAKSMSVRARWGSADGTAFSASAFLAAHPQYDWMNGLLQSRPAEPWITISAGEP